MNCPNCNTPNGGNVRFCRNCGRDLGYTAPTQTFDTSNTANQLLLVLGIEYFIYLLWFLLQKAVIPAMTKNGDGSNYDKISSIYNYVGWATDILSIATLLAFSIIIKNKNARICLILFLLLRIVFLIGYRVLDKI